MPPRSKRHRSVTPSKPGKLVQHVLDNYSTLPAVSSDFVKGHVLYIYVTSGDRSRTKTRKELITHIPSTSQDTRLTERIFRYLDAGIKRIVAVTLEKFTKPSDPNEFQEFCRICRVSFLLDPGMQDDSSRPTPMETQPGVDKEGEVPSIPPIKSVLPNTPIKTRQIAKCMNCKRLRNSLKALRQKQLVQKENTVAIRNILAKQKKNSAVKTLNQAIKRKNAQIESLKAKLSSGVGDDDDVAKLRALTWSLNKRHSAVKSYHRRKKLKDSSQVDISFEEEVVDLRAKCKKKDEEIVALQVEKIELEEKVDEYENAIKPTKADGKGYNMKMRMIGV